MVLKNYKVHIKSNPVLVNQCKAIALQEPANPGQQEHFFGTTRISQPGIAT